MGASISCPVIVLPEYRVTLDEVCDTVSHVQATDPRIAVLVRHMRRTGVQTRHWVRPPDEVLRQSDIARDLPRTFEQLTRLGVEAGRQALEGAGIAPLDVDCLITASVSGYVMPGLDIHVINQLGLRTSVRRIPVAQIGCAGGAYALVRAHEFIAAHPGSTVLIVCSEAFSSVLQPGDTAVDSAIYKALGGDGAASCVVRDHDSGLVINETWENVTPGTIGAYNLRMDQAGLHFESTREALEAVEKSVPVLHDWLNGLEIGGWPLDFVVAHPGGPRILEMVASGMDLPPDKLRHSWESLSQIANCGSVSVLDVLRRGFDDIQRSQRGILVAFGPGFSTVVCTLAAR